MNSTIDANSKSLDDVFAMMDNIMKMQEITNQAMIDILSSDDESVTSQNIKNLRRK